MSGMSAEIPQPSSVTIESLVREPDVQRAFEGLEIHSAKRGVIFHRTELLVLVLLSDMEDKGRGWIGKGVE